MFQEQDLLFLILFQLIKNDLHYYSIRTTVKNIFSPLMSENCKNTIYEIYSPLIKEYSILEYYFQKIYTNYTSRWKI